MADLSNEASDADADLINSVAIDEMSSVFAIRGKEREPTTQLCVAKYLLSGNVDDLVSGTISLCSETIKANDDTVAALKHLGVPTVTVTGPMHIPIATVEDDNRELVFGRPGVPDCSRGDDCQANFIPGHPTGPLGVYRGPGHHESNTECLLCLRHRLAMIVTHHRNNNVKVPVGLLPPFQNKANCIGGYRSAFCAVTPDDMHIISGGVHICGAPIGMKKVYDPYRKVWVIDQSVAVYGGRQDFFF